VVILNNLLEVVLPAFFVIAVGIIIGRRFKPDIAPINRIALFTTSPALIFHSLSKTELAFGNVAKLLFVYLLFLLVMISLSYLISYRFNIGSRRGLMATGSFANSGNLNLPIALFAFGQVGLELAVVLYVLTTALMFVLVPLIMTGGSKSFDFKRILALPVLWATLLALLINVLHLQLPTGLDRGIEILSQGAIPLVLLLLGMQIARSGLIRPSAVNIVGAFTKLVLSPIIAFLLGSLFGLRGLNLSILVLIAAMPPAVMNFLLALEFDASPEEVAGTIVLSTIAALLTISVVVSLLV